MLNQTDKLNFYKEIYYKEIERSAHLLNSLNTQIGITSAILTIQFYLITSYNFDSVTQLSSILSKSFLFICLISFLITIFSIRYLVLAYSNAFKKFTRRGLPNLIEFEDYGDRLRIASSNEELINQVYTEHLIEVYLSSADSITAKNDKQSKNIAYSKVYSVAASISLIFQISMFLLNFLNKPEEIKKVNIMNIQSLEKGLDSVKIKMDSIIFINKNIQINLSKQKEDGK